MVEVEGGGGGVGGLGEGVAVESVEVGVDAVGEELGEAAVVGPGLLAGAGGAGFGGAEAVAVVGVGGHGVGVVGGGVGLVEALDVDENVDGACAGDGGGEGDPTRGRKLHDRSIRDGLTRNEVDGAGGW